MAILASIQLTEEPDIDFPILDNHMHLDPRGQMENAVTQFARTGGTHIVLVNKPYSSDELVASRSYEKRYEITLKLAEGCRSSHPDVVVFVVLGPYPVDLLRLSEHMPLEEAEKIMLDGMELARKYVEEGKAIAIGEIGRPHFPVDDEIMKLSNSILRYGMSCAKDADCPVVLHTESATERVWQELAEMADLENFSRERVIKHFSGPVINEEANFGLFPSVLASKHNVKDAIKSGSRFMMETDYLDDPKRPGAVLGMATVPKMTRMLLRQQLATREQLIDIHKEHPERIYGIEIDL